MKIPKVLLRERLTVEAYTGTGAHGDAYGDPFTIHAHVEPKRRIVRSSTGEQTVSEAMAWARMDGDLPAESRVEWNGHTYRVISTTPIPREAGVEIVLGASAT